MFIKFYYLVILVWFISSAGIAQESFNKNAYNLYDNIVGIENTSLYNGIAYNETHRIDNDYNKFLLQEGFERGAVFYDGEPYFNVLMNYNIFNDLLLVKLKNEVSSSTFQLISEKVKSFKVNGQNFTRIKGNLQKDILSGFYEVLLDNRDKNIQLLKKHRLKELVDLGNNEFAVYSYKKRNSKFLIKTEEDIFPIERKSDLQDIFPEFKNEISEFYRTYRSLKKTNIDTFLVNLLQSLTLKSKY